MAGLAGAVSCAFPRVAHAATAIVLPTATGNRRFSVLYKGDRIGAHTVLYSSATGETRVDTEIHLLVKVAFFTVFAFSHRSTETWRAGRLMSLNSETVEHGETLHVEGATIPQGFRVVSKGRSLYRVRRNLDVKQPVDPGGAGAGDGGRRAAWWHHRGQRTQACRRANRDRRPPGLRHALYVDHTLSRRQHLV
jgi:hypothetical protein